MRKTTTTAATHRDLSHLNSKLFQTLATRSSRAKNTSPQPSTLGKWDNLIAKTETPKTPSTAMSKTASQAQRYNESIQAFRTLNPMMNDEIVKKSSKRMLEVSGRQDNPGNWNSILKKTSNIQDLNKLGKRVYKPKQIETSNLPERRLLKAHPYKQHDYRSQIASIPSSTNRNPPERSPSQKKHVQFYTPQRLNTSSYTTRANNTSGFFPETERAVSPAKLQLAKFLSTSIQDEPIVKYVSPKKYHNKESDSCFFDGGILNKFSKGKKLSERPQSTEMLSVAESMQPLNNMTKGKSRMNSPVNKTPTSHLFEANFEFQPTSQRGQSVFSYRTFASNVPL